MKRRLRYVLLVALVWLFPAMAMCGNVQLSAKLDSALLLMGKTADKKRKLYNGMIKCDLFMYLK